jgi:hypothetical protein
MIFKCYCAVFFNPSEGSPKKIGGTGIAIYTFASAIDVKILTDFFKSFNRNFLLFDLDKNSSGFNLMDKTKEEQLFGFLNNQTIISEYESLSNTLLDDILNQTIDIPKINPIIDDEKPHYISKLKKSNREYDDFSIDENMSNKEINEMMNKIIDKGIENLTENDKKMLQKLSNLR